MATYSWSVPTGNIITGNTYIKDTDNKIQDTMDDLADFVNSSGAYTGQGLMFDYVNKASNQTITGVKTHTQPIVGSVNGNSTTATKLQTARTISLSSDVTGSASFDGSANISITTSLVASKVLASIKTVDGVDSGLDAEYIGGIHYLNATGVTTGSTTVDPNTTTDEYILTNHVNTPNSSYYWHIRTQFYSTKTSTSNRAQIAIKYSNHGSASVYTRSSYSNVWASWEKLVSATDAQALHPTDALRISGNTIYLYKGDGENENVTLPSPAIEVIGAVSFAGSSASIIGKKGIVSSVVRNSVGVYTINISSTSSYYVSVSGKRLNTQGCSINLDSKTNTAIVITASYGGDNTVGAYDPALIDVIIYG